MTEAVQRRLELMTEELEEMQRTKLFTQDEIRIILTKRKEFEHKIHAISKELKSFTDYICYERCLLRDIHLRRDKYQIGEKRESIEHRIIKRIKCLYEMTLQRFPENFPLFFSFLKFCKKANYFNAASDAVSNMLKKHSDDPQMWHIAAHWHAYDRKDTKTAMILLLKGVAIHKNNKLLYKEMIEVELLELEKARKELQAVDVCLEKIFRIITSILDNIADCGFVLELLALIDKSPSTFKLQEMVVEKLLQQYPANEELWHGLAQRERRDLPELPNDASDEQPKKRTPKAKLEACFAKYREGLNAVSPANKPKLWLLYLDFLLKLQQETHGAGTVLKMETLKNALSEVSDEGYLLERHYLAWIDLVDEKEGLEIAKKSTQAIPDSVELWKARLKLQIIKDIPAEVNKVFKLGIEALKENAFPLWSSIIRYHYLTSNDDFIGLIYEDAVQQPNQISDILKPQYLEWLVLTKGIEQTRMVYRKLAVVQPFCKELHFTMSKLEALQIHFNLKAWEEVHELACQQFGKDDVDVWINYIQFHLQYNNEHPDLNERVQRIRIRALDVLPAELNCLFDRKYNLVTEWS